MSTNVVEVDHLPFGQRAVWHEDLNTVSVLRHLTPAEREAALDELLAEWRRALAGSACKPSRVGRLRRLSALTLG